MADPDPKQAALAAHGTLNPRPAKIRDELFAGSDFFDPRDLVQVRYEMLRRVRVEGRSVSRVAADFGVSRPTYYQARDAFQSEGLAGLLPKKRGPKAAHKLTDEVVDFLHRIQAEQPSLKTPGLAARVGERFGLAVHPRSVERALARRRERRRQKKGLR